MLTFKSENVKMPESTEMPCPKCGHKQTTQAWWAQRKKEGHPKTETFVPCAGGCGAELREVVPIFFTPPYGWFWEMKVVPKE